MNVNEFKLAHGMGNFTRGQKKQRPAPNAGLACEVEGCDVTECSGWFAKGRCCSKTDCKEKMGVKGVRGAADGIRKPRPKKEKRVLTDVTNGSTPVLSAAAAQLWQQGARSNKEMDAVRKAAEARAEEKWNKYAQACAEFFLDALALENGIEDVSEEADRKLIIEYEEKLGRRFPRRPAAEVAPAPPAAP